MSITPFDVFAMTLSSKGPVVFPFEPDFSALLFYDIDFQQNVNEGSADYISGVFVDNYFGQEDLTITCDTTNQSLIFKAGTQSYMPVLSPRPHKFKCSVSSPTLISPKIIFNNIPLMPFVWPVNSGGGGGGGSGLTDDQLRAEPLPVISSAITPFSFTVVLTGDNQLALPAGQGDDYFFISNRLGNGPLNVNITGGDAETTPDYVLNAGDSFTLERGLNTPVFVSGVTGQYINIVAATKSIF